MPTPDVLDFVKLLAPIPGDKPGGADIRINATPTSLYYQIKDGRNAARATERRMEGGLEDAVPPDWKAVSTAAMKALAESTKDLEVTAYLIEAFCRQENLPLWLTRGVLFTTWDKTRNLAIDVALDNAAFDYFLFCDADMEAFGTIDDEALTAPAYAVTQKHGTLAWRNFRLVRVDAHPKYVGVTHEYTSLTGKVENLDSLWFIDHCDGGNRPGKFERDIALLVEALKAEPNNARYLYYLGQSYRDALRHQDAIDAFTKRIALGGWDEETFYAMLERARAAKRL